MDTDASKGLLAPVAAPFRLGGIGEPRGLMAVLSVWLLVGLVGCTAGNGSRHADGKDADQTSPRPDTTERGCSPGELPTCDCASGASGTRTCGPDGSWQACDCGEITRDAGAAEPGDAIDTENRADSVSAPPDWSDSSDIERTLVARQGASEISVGGAPAVVASDNGTGEFIDSRVEGAIRGPVETINVSDTPDLTPPPDVPMSAGRAASGC